MTQHDDFLDKWSQLDRHRNKCFIRDGIIDPVNWGKDRKILFILREAYDRCHRPEGFDLCHTIREKWKGPKGRTWWTVARWAFIAHYGTEVWTPPLLKHSKPLWRESLIASAVVNVKKSNGRKRSDLKEIKCYAHEDAVWLRGQIDIINPDIVICGGTWKAIRPLWVSEPECVFDRVYRIGSRLFLSFQHPANRSSTSLNYYGLACLLQNARYLTGEKVANRQVASAELHAMTDQSRRHLDTTDR